MVGSAWWWLALSSCTYVTESEFAAQLDQRDEDGDGVSVGEGDCDDSDPEVYPGRLEIAYDGIDNDCLGNGDLADVDGDGFRSTRVGGDDCDDTDANVAPGKFDAPYDGIDADCAKDNDFDFDGDGVMALVATPNLVEQYQQSSGARFVPAYGDCNDEDASVFPGSPEEVPYDGVDSDCDGSNDFDADGDGFERDVDCLDQVDPTLPGDPVAVYPDAPDPPYDGIDSDCEADNDFDADGDGFIRDEDLVAYQTYEATYGLSFGAVIGDCDDDRGFVNPHGLERLGDLLDQNCDGQPDRATWTIGDFSLVSPQSLRVVSADEGFLAILGAEELGSPTLPTTTNAMLATLFDGQLGPSSTPLDAEAPFSELPSPIGAAVSLKLTTNGVALGLTTSDGGAGRLATFGELDLTAGTIGSLTRSETRLNSLLAPVAADVALLADGLGMLTCEGSTLFLVDDSGEVSADVGGPVTTCFLDTNDEAVGCTTSGCRAFSATVGPTSLTNPLDDPAPVAVARQRSVLRAEVLDGAGGLRIIRSDQQPLEALTNQTFRQADATEASGEWFASAITEPSAGPPELRVLWGQATGPLASTVLAGFDPQRPGLEPIETAIAANDDRVLILVTLTDGTDEVLAWTVYERTP